MFYLSPPAVNSLLEQSLTIPGGTTVLVDNLAKAGCQPGGPANVLKERCGEVGKKYGKVLGEHKAIWGGAIHMAEFQ